MADHSRSRSPLGRWRWWHTTWEDRRWQQGWHLVEAHPKEKEQENPKGTLALVEATPNENEKENPQATRGTTASARPTMMAPLPSAGWFQALWISMRSFMKVKPLPKKSHRMAPLRQLGAVGCAAEELHAWPGPSSADVFAGIPMPSGVMADDVSSARMEHFLRNHLCEDFQVDCCFTEAGMHVCQNGTLGARN